MINWVKTVFFMFVDRPAFIFSPPSQAAVAVANMVTTVYRRLAFLQPAPTYPPRIREHNERQCISRVSTCVESSQNKKRDINPVQREEFILNPAPPGLSTNQPAKDFLV